VRNAAVIAGIGVVDEDRELLRPVAPAGMPVQSRLRAPLGVGGVPVVVAPRGEPVIEVAEP
jgi:hypothetical protein